VRACVRACGVDAMYAPPYKADLLRLAVKMG